MWIHSGRLFTNLPDEPLNPLALISQILSQSVCLFQPIACIRIVYRRQSQSKVHRCPTIIMRILVLLSYLQSGLIAFYRFANISGSLLSRLRQQVHIGISQVVLCHSIVNRILVLLAYLQRRSVAFMADLTFLARSSAVAEGKSI